MLSLYPECCHTVSAGISLSFMTESFNPLDDIVLSPTAGAFGDVERLGKPAVLGVGFLPDGTHADSEQGSDFGVRQK